MRTRQDGMASLITALVLMLSMTLITLSTAGTHLTETRMAGNEHRHYRLRLIAESAWEGATRRLVDETRALTWQTEPGTGFLVSREALPAGDEGVETRLVYRRPERDSPWITLEAVAAQAGGGAQTVRINQSLRQLTVLSPLAESAPPLVLNGCLSPAAAVDIRPVNSDRANAGDALWQFGGGGCAPAARLDRHGGRRVERAPTGDLWNTLLSVDREAFAQLAAGDLPLPASKRRYWLAETASGQPPVWRQSVGSPEQPAVVVFPAAGGCPRFAAGVRIFGVVFIDAACLQPLADAHLEVTGSLIVNGGLETGIAHLRLNHIQVADPEQTRLRLPVLRVARVPGSWRDF